MRDALQILVRPRATMRRILDSGRLRWMPQVIAAALLSSMTESKNRPLISSAVLVDTLMQNAPIIVGGLLLGCAAVLLFFYGLSWIAWFAGRTFEGTGSPREIRSALAWGLLPVIVVSAVQLPLILALPAGTFSVDVRTCGTAAFLAGLGVVMLAWYLVVGSLALAEAHRVSAFGGIASLLLTWLSPVVLVVAAILSFR